jgi:hypothetical protein
MDSNLIMVAIGRNVIILRIRQIRARSAAK